MTYVFDYMLAYSIASYVNTCISGYICVRGYRPGASRCRIYAKKKASFQTVNVVLDLYAFLIYFIFFLHFQIKSMVFR